MSNVFYSINNINPILLLEFFSYIIYTSSSNPALNAQPWLMIALIEFDTYRNQFNQLPSQ